MRIMITLRNWLSQHLPRRPCRWLRNLWRLSHTRREVRQLSQVAEQAQAEHAAREQRMAERAQAEHAALEQRLAERARVEYAALEQQLAEQARLIGELQHEAEQARKELSGAAPLYKHVELPFSHAEPAPDWIANAERVLGIRLADLPAGERERWFYSFYSEMAGGVEHILQQQYRVYLPLLPVMEDRRVLDIGCGAGEFLNFLRQQGIKALGLDLDAQEVARARLRGLDAIQMDAQSFFQNVDESFSAITLFQVIEHVPAGQVEPLLSDCISALAPGGVLVVETVNLRHPNALNGFYTDPTHQRPLSDNYLSFLLQWHGLERVEIIYTLPEWLPGISSAAPPRCYANFTVIGYRSA